MYKIKDSLVFRQKELKGMLCKFIAITDSNIAFVEFKENINGGSVDGLGKTGHCIPVPSKLLQKVT